MSSFASTSLIKNYGIRNRIARADRQFNICHSYGTDFIFPETEDNHNLFARKNIRGRFRHWGIKISEAEAHLGRLIYGHFEYSCKRVKKGSR